MEDFTKLEYEKLRSIEEKVESRYFQLILFTLTAFSVIIGFNEKIKPDYYIPLMLYIVLFFTTTAGTRSKILMVQISAYLDEEYFKKDPKTYFSKFYINEICPKNFITRILIYAKNYFLVFNIFPLLFTIKAYKNILTYQEFGYYLALILIIGFQISIINRVIDMIKKNMKFFEQKINDFKNDNRA